MSPVDDGFSYMALDLLWLYEVYFILRWLIPSIFRGRVLQGCKFLTSEADIAG